MSCNIQFKTGVNRDSSWQERVRAYLRMGIKAILLEGKNKTYALLEDSKEYFILIEESGEIITQGDWGSIETLEEVGKVIGREGHFEVSIANVSITIERE